MCQVLSTYAGNPKGTNTGHTWWRRVDNDVVHGTRRSTCHRVWGPTTRWLWPKHPVGLNSPRTRVATEILQLFSLDYAVVQSLIPSMGVMSFNTALYQPVSGQLVSPSKYVQRSMGLCHFTISLSAMLCWMASSQKHESEKADERQDDHVSRSRQHCLWIYMDHEPQSRCRAWLMKHSLWTQVACMPHPLRYSPFCCRVSYMSYRYLGTYSCH